MSRRPKPSKYHGWYVPRFVAGFPLAGQVRQRRQQLAWDAHRVRASLTLTGGSAGRPQSPSTFRPRASANDITPIHIRGVEINEGDCQARFPHRGPPVRSRRRAGFNRDVLFHHLTCSGIVSGNSCLRRPNGHYASHPRHINRGCRHVCRACLDRRDRSGRPSLSLPSPLSWAGRSPVVERTTRRHETDPEIDICIGHSFAEQSAAPDRAGILCFRGAKVLPPARQVSSVVRPPHGLTPTYRSGDTQTNTKYAAVGENARRRKAENGRERVAEAEVEAAHPPASPHPRPPFKGRGREQVQASGYS